MTSEAFHDQVKRFVPEKGYEPNASVFEFVFRCLPMERARSLDVNPFYSDRVKSEMVLRAARPEALPPSPAVEGMTEGQGGQRPGKGRGGGQPTGAGRGCYVTPPPFEDL